jgi:NADPH:quinone reductase
MKAVQCVEWGEPERLVLADVPLPEPKSGEVRIKVNAAGVNFPDALIVQRKYQLKPPLPFTPGTEVAGSIDALGDGVDGFTVGQRVIAFVGLGGFAEYACAPARLVTRIPENVSDEAAAAFTLTYATSQHALVNRAQIAPGETLLVLGAGGGVGLAAIELGKIAGARVIAAASSEDKLQAAAERGADAVFNYTTTDLRDAITSMTHGRGVDVVYDPVGGDQSEVGVRCLAWRGRLLVVGFAQGEIPKLPANFLLLKEASALGVFWGEFARREPRANQAMLRELFGWLAQGRLKPLVSRTYPLGDTALALRALLERRVVGKLVVVPH